MSEKIYGQFDLETIEKLIIVAEKYGMHCEKQIR